MSVGTPRSVPREETALVSQVAKPDAFVSYSRSDTLRVLSIVDELAELGDEVWIDRADIPHGSDWRQRIESGIAASSALVFMISDQSLLSTECIKELSQASDFGKRVIPVLLAEVEAEVPVELEALNWVLATEGHAKRIAAEIHEALGVDLEWVDFHTRLLEKALAWMMQEQERSLLLRGADLEQVQITLDMERATVPEVTPLQDQFVAASSRAEVKRRRTWVAVATVVIVVTSAAAIAAIQWVRAENASRTAESLRLASDGELLSDNQLDLGLVLTLAGGTIDSNDSVRDGLIRALTFGPGYRSSRDLHVDHLEGAAFLGGSDRMLLTNSNGNAFLLGSNSQIEDIASSPVLSIGASASAATFGLGTVTGASVYDSSEGQSQYTCEFDSPVTALDVDDLEGIMAVAISDGGIAEVRVVTPECGTVSSTSSPEPISYLEIVDGADILVAGSPRGGLSLHQPSSGLDYETLPLSESVAVRSMAVSDDQRHLAVGTESGQVMLWNLRTFEPPFVFDGGHSGAISALSFEPGGSRLVSGGLDGELYLWEPRVDRSLAGPLLNLGGDKSASPVVAIHVREGAAEATSLHLDGQLLEWSLRDKSPLVSQLSVQSGVTSLVHEGTRIIVGGTDGIEIIQTEPTNGHRLTRTDHQVTALNSVDGTDDLIVGTNAGGVYTMRPDGTVGARFEDHLGRTTSVDATSSGQLVASGGIDGSVLLSSIEGELFADLQHGPGYVSEVVFTPEDDHLLSAGQDGAVRIWKVPSGELWHEFDLHTGSVDALALSPSGSLVASGSDDRSILIWNWSTREVVGELHGHTDRVLAVSFSPDGLFLASSSEDATVIVWELATGSIVGQPLRNEFGAQPQTVAFSPSSPSVLAAGGSGVQLWNLSAQSVMQQACRIVGNRNLTDAELRRYSLVGPPDLPC